MGSNRDRAAGRYKVPRMAEVPQKPKYMRVRDIQLLDQLAAQREKVSQKTQGEAEGSTQPPAKSEGHSFSIVPELRSPISNPSGERPVKNYIPGPLRGGGLERL